MLNINDNKTIKLFANCIPVKGYSRSLICDLQRNAFDFIPHSLYDILLKIDQYSIKALYDNFASNERERSILTEYLEFLLQKEYAHLCEIDEVILFPAMDMSFEDTSLINNCIIDDNGDNYHNYQEIFNIIEGLGCQTLQLRFIGNHSLPYIERVLNFLQDSLITNVELIVSLKYLKVQEVSLIATEHLRVYSITAFDSNKPNKQYIYGCEILFNINPLPNILDCGCILPDYFSVNIKNFTESLHKNSCLNKKLGIDQEGYIKNCPSSEHHYGKISKTTCKTLIDDENFKALWNITKDQVEECKVCEFRYMCSDCRIFISDKKNIFSKPKKCNYDPYTGVWKN